MTSVKNSMYDVLKLLMDKAVHYSWPSVRSFYTFCAKQVELDRITWMDISYFNNKAQVHFKHSDLHSNTSFKDKVQATTGTKENPRKAKDAYCKAWNYTSKCSCSQSDTTYKDTHLCKVCDRHEHAMLHCPKCRMPILQTW